ncbi:retrotransposon protein, putative, ty1-copia subclass, partial [Tanacetum coccineum]
QELLQTVRDFHTCKQEEGEFVSSYVIKMKRYIDQLERLSHPVTLNLGVSLILVGDSKEYDSFVQNYNMHNMGKTVNELHDMLKLHEETLPKKVAAPALHAIRAGKVQKNKNKKPSKAAKGVQGKGNGKKAYAYVEPSYAPKPKNPPPPKKDNPTKDAICHHYGEVGIFTIELYSFPSTSWVYDTGCAVEAIRNYHLCLPSGLVIVLNNCYYAPSITRGIISASRLYEDGFINRFELNNAISVSKNNIVYFSAIPSDGVYKIEMSCSNTNDSSMYVVSNKRAKLNLDSSLLWHCRLGHISKKRIEKLQHDRLLNSTDIESLEKCVSCMSRKMARKPYSHQVEIAKDLLGLIHTDVCGPFRIVSRQGANYCVTFTDDFSRYGYVYLLKHKHEVFDTFKVFQKEVKNQLGKTIKSLRSNREGCPKETIGYSFYNPSENKVFVAQNAEFFESNLIDQDASGSLEDLEIIQEEDRHGWCNIRAIRILIAIATFYDYEIWQMNVKTAFLNGRLSEEVYMTQPKGFVNPKYPNHICKLKRSIHGLKQASRQWNKRFDDKSRNSVSLKIVMSHNIGELHWTTVKNILKYLGNTKDMFLVYGGDMKRELRVSCYTDVGYLTDADDLRSQTGYVFILYGGAVDWKSIKQSIFATSSTDAEYITTFDASKEAVWIYKSIYGLNVVPIIEEPITMYCDNTGAIAIANDH